jgi:hypothetical protein
MGYSNPIASWNDGKSALDRRTSVLVGIVLISKKTF